MSVLTCVGELARVFELDVSKIDSVCPGLCVAAHLHLEVLLNTNDTGRGRERLKDTLDRIARKSQWLRDISEVCEQPGVLTDELRRELQEKLSNV